MPRTKQKTTKCFPSMKTPTPKDPRDIPRELRMCNRKLTELFKRVDRYTKLAMEISSGAEEMLGILDKIENELVDIRIANDKK